MHVLLLLLSFGQLESVWDEPRPLADIAASIMARGADLPSHLPADIAELASAADVTATVTARPSEHYYRTEIKFQALRLSGTKTLEVWGLGQQTRFRSRVSLAWGRNGPLVRWLLYRVELRVMQFERQKLRELTN